MNLEYKKIENNYDKYLCYTKALSWDTKNTYSQDNEVGIEWLLEYMIGAYNDEKLVALGCIRKYYDIEKEQIYAKLACIVDYKFRQNGISTRLLKELFEYCKQLNVEIVKADILKNNVPSISQAEKLDFNLVSTNDNIHTYEKKLIISK